jgi:hypothetical protein
MIGTISWVERRVTVSSEAAYALSAMFLGSFVMLLLVAWLSDSRRRPLNPTHDPASVLGIASLVASNLSVLAPFKDLDQTQKKDMVAALKDRSYITFPRELREVPKTSTRPISECLYCPFPPRILFPVSSVVLEKILRVLLPVLSGQMQMDFFEALYNWDCLITVLYPLVLSVTRLVLMFIGHKNGTIRISKWKPFAARRRTLFRFAFYLIALVVAISVLYRSTNQSALN